MRFAYFGQHPPTTAVSVCYAHDDVDDDGDCWNLSGPNLRPETNPRHLTASYPSVPYLIIIPTYHRTISAPNYLLRGHFITFSTYVQALVRYGQHPPIYGYRGTVQGGTSALRRIQYASSSLSLQTRRSDRIPPN